MTTLDLVLQKIESENKIKNDAFYSHSKMETVINESDMDDVFEWIYTIIIWNIHKSIGKGSSWIIDSAIEHNINISKYDHLAGSSYIKLSKELDHPGKGPINIQNIDDNECFKWSLASCLNAADHHPARISKADNACLRKLDFKDIEYPEKIRDFQKIKKKNSSSISVLGYENKKRHPIYGSKKCCEEKHVDLLLIGKEAKRCYVLKQDFNTFMYDHSLHRLKTFLSLLFTSFQYRRNIKTSY